MNIVGMEAHAALKFQRLDARERGHDAVHKGLRADDAGAGVVPGLPDQMLPRAEADFKPGFRDRIGEKRGQAAFAKGPAQVKPQALKPSGEERSLPRGQFAAPSAPKGTQGATMFPAGQSVQRGFVFSVHDRCEAAYARL